MINLLSIASHKSKYSRGYYPTFAIDGVPLEVWLPRQNPDTELDLVAAHSGSYRDEDTWLIWDRIYSTAPGWKTLVPLLVCSDDLDLTCTVIVTGQCANKHHVQWSRFGLLRDLLTMESPSVDWYDAIPSLTFERLHYQSVLDEFRKQENIKMDWD
ncbi:hypothetical protein [Pseudomonas putida]|uniref:hypothetical protein n=1 Tax=Pseudomonas putida TaxID=303 RepID=UPI002365FE23|nr:hypothetical protein [Pseudomonas putida]MDD2050677.1 hypothetical protein [Pseudomonas putida]